MPAFAYSSGLLHAHIYLKNYVIALSGRWIVIISNQAAESITHGDHSVRLVSPGFLIHFLHISLSRFTLSTHNAASASRMAASAWNSIYVNKTSDSASSAVIGTLLR